MCFVCFVCFVLIETMSFLSQTSNSNLVSHHLDHANGSDVDSNANASDNANVNNNGVRQVPSCTGSIAFNFGSLQEKSSTAIPGISLEHWDNAYKLQDEIDLKCFNDDVKDHWPSSVMGARLNDFGLFFKARSTDQWIQVPEWDLGKIVTANKYNIQDLGKYHYQLRMKNRRVDYFKQQAQVHKAQQKLIAKQQQQQQHSRTTINGGLNPDYSAGQVQSACRMVENWMLAQGHLNVPAALVTAWKLHRDSIINQMSASFVAMHKNFKNESQLMDSFVSFFRSKAEQYLKPAVDMIGSSQELQHSKHSMESVDNHIETAHRHGMNGIQANHHRDGTVDVVNRGNNSYDGSRHQPYNENMNVRFSPYREPRSNSRNKTKTKAPPTSQAPPTSPPPQQQQPQQQHHHHVADTHYSSYNSGYYRRPHPQPPHFPFRQHDRFDDEYYLRNSSNSDTDHHRNHFFDSHDWNVRKQWSKNEIEHLVSSMLDKRRY